MPQAAVVALVGWTLFAFAGAYRWTMVPALAGALGLLVATRPRVLGRGSRLLDAAILLTLAAGALQLVPLPARWRAALSPSVADLETAIAVGVGPLRAAPLTVDPDGTAWALALAVWFAIVFWSARAIFARHGLRTAGRGIAWCGMALAVVVFVQRYTSPHQIYGFWTPVSRTSNPSPLGPFVNRNDLATWLLLAIPVVVGYAAARVGPHLRDRRWPAALERAFDVRTIVLGGAAVLMTAAVVASLSRSGLIGLLAVLGVLASIGRMRLGRTGTRAFTATLVAAVLLTVPFTNVDALSLRLGRAVPGDVAGRMRIWADSWAMARDFLGTGLGLGAFERGMLLYQRGSRALFYNHAHNEYLQLLAEGGLMVAAPAAVAMAALVAGALRRLRRDHGAAFWFRAGAISGIAGVAVQGIWDTGLRMPANAVLFAVVAAMAAHESPRTDPADRAPRVITFGRRRESPGRPTPATPGSAGT